MTKEKTEKIEESAVAVEKPAVQEAKVEEKEDIQAVPLETPRPKKKKAKKEKPVWVEYKPKEIEEMIVNLSNQGHTASEIGLILKDQNGVLNVKEATKKTITEILVAAGIKHDLPEDLLYLIKNAVALNEHFKKNRHDMTAKHGYELTVSKIRRLTKYYIAKKRIPSDWRYSIETASLLVK